MTENRILQIKLGAMRELALTVQRAFHTSINMKFANRHQNTLEQCTEDSCKDFWKCLKNIDDTGQLYQVSEKK